jgi:hypothetical protein
VVRELAADGSKVVVKGMAEQLLAAFEANEVL